MGRLTDLIKTDSNRILTDPNGFAETITLITTRSGGMTIAIEAVHTKHHLGFDMEKAQEINTLKAHVALSEQELIDLGYPYRDAKKKVHMKGDKVIAKQANGVDYKYVVESWFENDKTGTITLILGDYSPQ